LVSQLEWDSLLECCIKQVPWTSNVPSWHNTCLESSI
jgi:hypothetical protein